MTFWETSLHHPNLVSHPLGLDNVCGASSSASSGRIRDFSNQKIFIESPCFVWRSRNHAKSIASLILQKKINYLWSASMHLVSSDPMVPCFTGHSRPVLDAQCSVLVEDWDGSDESNSRRPRWDSLMMMVVLVVVVVTWTGRNNCLRAQKRTLG